MYFIIFLYRFVASMNTFSRCLWAEETNKLFLWKIQILWTCHNYYYSPFADRVQLLRHLQSCSASSHEELVSYLSCQTARALLREKNPPVWMLRAHGFWGGETPSEWDLNLFADLRSCQHPSWCSPRILSTPLCQIHSFSTPTWHAAISGGRGENAREPRGLEVWIWCTFLCSEPSRFLMAAQLFLTTQRAKRTTIDYKSFCCSSSCKVMPGGRRGALISFGSFSHPKKSR